jgi:hypothetical protein
MLIILSDSLSVANCEIKTDSEAVLACIFFYNYKFDTMTGIKQSSVVIGRSWNKN